MEKTTKPEIENEDRELLARKSRRIESIKKSQTLPLTLLLLTVMSLALSLVIKHDVKSSEKKTVKRNKEHWEVRTDQHMHREGKQVHKDWVKIGIF